LTTQGTMSTRENVQELVTLVTTGQILTAFEKFYSEDVEMSENSNPPTVGKAANRLREEQFVGYVKEVHKNVAAKVLVDGDFAAIEWDLEFTGVDGNLVKYHQVALQEWIDGQIVRERFFYNAGH